MRRRMFCRLRTASVLGLVALVSANWCMAATKPAAGKKGAPAVTEIRLAHSLDADRAQALSELAERFNANSRDYRVALVEARDASGARALMSIVQGDDAARLLDGSARYKPLYAVMKEAGVPLQALRPPSYMMRMALDAQGRLLALPVGLSTPVLYVNREAFRRAGLDPEARLDTWAQLQDALGNLVDSGSVCPYTVSEPGKVMIENTSAWHNEPVAARRGRSETLSFNGMLQVKHVAMMASWHRARYLRIFEGSGEAEQRFTAGECAVIAAPSASWTDFRRRAGFDIGVRRLPYHDDFHGAPQNTLADGAALWVTAGGQATEYRGVARFVAFWLQPENQIAWQRASGYLPLNRAGVLAAQNEVRSPDLENVAVAVSQLANRPATTESSASSLISDERVRRILDEELGAVWADRKPAKEALDNAVSRARILSPRL